LARRTVDGSECRALPSTGLAQPVNPAVMAVNCQSLWAMPEQLATDRGHRTPSARCRIRADGVDRSI
jgi:hypothetical protein